MWMIVFFVVETIISLFDFKSKRRSDFTSANVVDVFNVAKQVNIDVNKATTWTSDEETMGMMEYFQAPSTMLASRKGDCDDYAILKWYELMGKGICRSQMSFMVCKYLPNWERHLADPENVPKSYHMVLLLDINDRTYVLDNIGEIKELDERTDLGRMYTFGRRRGELDKLSIKFLRWINAHELTKYNKKHYGI